MALYNEGCPNYLKLEFRALYSCSLRSSAAIFIVVIIIIISFFFKPSKIEEIVIFMIREGNT